MIGDPWSRQLDGRVIHQHLTIFEPELRSQHFQRLSRLAKESILSDDFLHSLAISGPRERAVAFLLELLHDTAADRAASQDVSEAYRQSDRLGPLVIGQEGEDPYSARLAEMSQELTEKQISYLVDLSVGALVKSNAAIASRQKCIEGAHFGLVITPEFPSTSFELLFIGSKTLMMQWHRLESEIMDPLLDSSELAPALSDQFGRDVVAHLTSNMQTDPGQPGTLVPDTPFCRDLALAWRQSTNRAEHTIGAAINHCTRLADIRMLGRQHV